MIYVRPKRDNPIYVEWKKWADICDTCYSSTSAAAKESIEKIAQFIYRGQSSCIVGSMIIMRDEELIEQEEIMKQAYESGCEAGREGVS